MTAETRHDNGVGFNKTDAAVLQPIADELIKTDMMSLDDEAECRKRLPKYVGQLEHLLKDEEVF